MVALSGATATADPPLLAENAAPTRLIRCGFALEPPEPALARRGAYDGTTLTLFSPGLRFWVDVGALQAGDHLVLRLKGPDGGVMAARDIPIDLAKDRFFAYSGVKRPGRGWTSGRYVGTVQVVRGDQIVVNESTQTALP